MRVWVGTDASGLRTLLAGEPLPGERLQAESEDEEHEHEAMLRAAEHGVAVVVAEVDAEEPLTLDVVHAVHVDDGTGDLAWYATQEIDVALAALPDD